MQDAFVGFSHKNQLGFNPYWKLNSLYEDWK